MAIAQRVVAFAAVPFAFTVQGSHEVRFFLLPGGYPLRTFGVCIPFPLLGLHRVFTLQNPTREMAY